MESNNALDGYALITGASSGIGLELAKLMAAHGHSLVLVARSKDKLESLSSELSSRHGIKVKVITKDLSVIASCREIYDELSRENIRVDILVNNAGFGGYGEFWKADFDHDVRMMSLNVVALVQLTKLFLKDMIQHRQGRVLNVASTAAFQPGPLMAVYYASKAFVLSFSEAIANETRGTGVTVTALCPGPTETNFRAAAGMTKSMRFSSQLNVHVEAVARAGYEGMKRGEIIVIPGFKNRIVAKLVRVMPRNFITRMVRKIQEARRD